MGDICRISVASVTLDDALQPREGIDQDHWREMAAWLRENPKDDLPPIRVVAEGEFRWCYDGFHRTLAYRDAGRRQVVADLRTGTRRDAMLLSFGTNGDHGLKRTHRDKQKVVRSMLSDEEWTGWADREIARACNVSADLVGRIRRESGQQDPTADRRSVKFVRAGQTVEMRLPKVAKPVPPSPAAVPAEPHLSKTTDEPARAIETAKTNFRTFVRGLPEGLYRELTPLLDPIHEVLSR